jgi:hypothetical protein
MRLARWGARWGLIAALVLSSVGCNVGGPRRASDIQNLNGISDDISAVDMTRSANTRARDPNISSTLPRNYEVHPDRP